MVCLCCLKHCAHGKGMNEECGACAKLYSMEDRKDKRIQELEAKLKMYEGKT